jgi:hypothetical protein
MKPSCLKCRFCEPANDAQFSEGHAGECRINPPVIHPACKEGDTPYGYWPDVGHDDWCSCFQPKEEEPEDKES